MSALIPYFGGKARLAKTIVDRMPEHTCYVEVFAGAAAVFFSKEPSKTEVINDLDKELITLYRAVQNHPEELHRQFKYALVARDEFNRLMKAAPEFFASSNSSYISTGILTLPLPPWCCSHSQNSGTRSNSK